MRDGKNKAFSGILNSCNKPQRSGQPQNSKRGTGFSDMDAGM